MRLQFARCALDLDRWELTFDGDPVALEPRAMRILTLLIERRDQLVTKAELMDAVWGDRFVSEAALTTQIKAIRRAVGDSGRAQSVLKTVHGRGYRFIAEARELRTDTPPPLVGASATDAPNPVVAVLPFEDLSPDGAVAHVAAGLTSDVITALAKHRWLRVLSRPTSSDYGVRDDAVGQLREDHGVDYAVGGSVRFADERLRVSVSLTDAVTGTCRWAERYDGVRADLFDVLDDITDVIAATVEPEVGLAERDRVRRRPRTDMRAWDLHHLGIMHLYRFTAADNAEAQRLLLDARLADPGFAEANAWWAYAVVLGMTYWDTEPDDAMLDDALRATTASLKADEHNALFHMLRGRVQLARRDYRAALVENRRAVDLNPSLAAAFCGLGDSLCYEGRYEEAIEQFQRSLDLGAHDPQRWAFLSYGALAHIFSGRCEEALEWIERAAVIPNCQYWTAAHRVVALALLGRREESDGAVATLLGQLPHFTVSYARRKLFYLKRPEQLARYLEALRTAGVREC